MAFPEAACPGSTTLGGAIGAVGAAAGGNFCGSVAVGIG